MLASASDAGGMFRVTAEPFRRFATFRARVAEFDRAYLNVSDLSASPAPRSSARPAKVAGIDTLKLTEKQRSDIATGKIVIEPAGKQETATISAAVRPSAQEFEDILFTGFHERN